MAADKVERLAWAVDEGKAAKGRLRARRRSQLQAKSTTKIDEGESAEGVVDSQALAAEFEAALSGLRALLSDSGEADAVSRVKLGQERHEGDEEDDGIDLRRKRLLRYRYVRKVEEPPPPLGQLEDLPPERRPETDKIERNRQGSILQWCVRAGSRAAGANKVFGEKWAVAKERRVKAEEQLEEHFAEKWAHYAARCATMVPAGAKAQERATLRSTRQSEAQQRRETVQVERRAQVLSKIERKDKGSKNSISVAPPPNAAAAAGLAATPNSGSSAELQPPGHGQRASATPAAGVSATEPLSVNFSGMEGEPPAGGAGADGNGAEAVEALEGEGDAFELMFKEEDEEDFEEEEKAAEEDEGQPGADGGRVASNEAVPLPGAPDEPPSGGGKTPPPEGEAAA